MMKYLLAALAAIVIVASALAYLDRRDDAAEQRGVDKQIAVTIAKANQNIAERRETDAHFDKFDAHALCDEYDLEWVFEDGKSFCR